MKVFMVVKDLPMACSPVHVTRNGQFGMTLVAVQAGAMKAEVAQRCVDLLSVEENNQLRAGWGQGPVGTPLEDWCLEGVIDLPVPEALRPRTNEDDRSTAGA